MLNPYVLGINGSERKEGNSGRFLKFALEIIESNNIKTKRIDLKGRKIKGGCTGCFRCRYRDATCEIKDDLQEIFEEMLRADGIILCAPVYWGFAPAKMKAVLERVGLLSEGRVSFDKPVIDLGDPALWPVTKKGPGLFARKLGGAIIVARRDGNITTYSELLLWMTANNFVVISSNYWTWGVGTRRVEKLNSKGKPIKLKDGKNILFEHSRDMLEKDKEGRETIQLFAENFAWATHKLKGNS